MSKRKTKRPTVTQSEIVKELKQDNRMLKQMMSYSDMNLALGNSINQYTPAQKHSLYTGIKKHFKSGVDFDYIKAIVFPELFSSDIPQPFTNMSYCRFSDRSNCRLNTGTGGKATVLFYPRVTCGPSLFYQQTDIPFIFDVALQAGLVQNYSQYFTQTNLVAASISIQYTGKLEDESGLFVGSQVFGIDPAALTFDDIENGQYITRCRPSEGIRFVHLPMDAFDYDLYPADKGNSHNMGAAPTGNEKIFTYVMNLGTTVFVNGQTGGTLVPPVGTTGYSAGANSIVYSSNTNYIAINWSGLPFPGDWLRCDIMRRFIGLPKSAYRDIVELVRTKKNFDSKKTFDVLRQLCINSPVGGHTLKELDKNQDALVGGLMNSQEAMHLGHLTGIETLSDLSSSLNMVGTAESKGLVGDYGLTSRIYPYTL